MGLNHKAKTDEEMSLCPSLHKRKGEENGMAANEYSFPLGMMLKLQDNCTM